MSVWHNPVVTAFAQRSDCRSLIVVIALEPQIKFQPQESIDH